MAKKARKKERKTRTPAFKETAPRIVVNNESSSDNDLCRANMKALKKNYPELARQVGDTPLNNKFELSKKVPQIKQNLYSKEGNFYYYNDNIDEDVADQIKALNLKNTRLAVFLGIGLGYELIYYMQSLAAIQNTNHILVIEKDMEIFKLALNSVNLVPVINNPGIRFIVGEKVSKIYARLRVYFAEKNRYVFVKAMKPIYHSSSLLLNKDYYLQVIKVLREAATHQIMFFGNDPYDSIIGIENMLANIKEITLNPGINLLFNKFKSKPAVVVSTGPSLNKNKHLLRGLEDKALIIAADASLKVLMDMNFKPHLVTSLERTSEVVDLFNGFSAAEVQDVYIAACPVVLNEVYQVYPGPRVIVYRNFDHFKWLGIDKGILDIQLSSGNMAFKIAAALGCNPIILIGQDLAFSRDGRTHAEGMIFGETDQISINEDKVTVMGNDGQLILTTPTWYSFLKGYEIDIAGYNGRCINSTEGGAFIQGAEVMPFQQSIDKYMKERFNPLEILKKYLSSFSTEEAKSDVMKTIELIDSTVQDMQDILLNCKKGLELCNRYQQKWVDILRNPENIKKLKNGVLKNIETEIMTPRINCQKMHNTFQLFFAHVYQSYLINHEIDNIAVPEKYDDINLARVEILLRQAESYAVIGDLANICLSSLVKARENLTQISMEDNSFD
ncbi:MAG: DUF115 domain-containing protein [Syntrophomonadaceae bacterium]|nr:DUF115 domain-containing protein [Syntrophomonadaceae bacterium]